MSRRIYLTPAEAWELKEIMENPEPPTEELKKAFSELADEEFVFFEGGTVILNGHPVPATHTLKLSPRDAKRLLDDLENPSPPNEALRRAAERYKERRGEVSSPKESAE